MASVLESATEGVRKQLVPIDLLDDNGDIAFEEWEKRNQDLKLTRIDFDNVAELTAEDWIKIILYKNEAGLAKTKLFKELFLFCQRTGLHWDWKPYDRGPYSDEVNLGLEKLQTEKIISVETKKSRDNRIYKLHEIKIKGDTEKLWDMLPESFKEVISRLVQEFANKSHDEIIHYVYSAYPEFAILAKNN